MKRTLAGILLLGGAAVLYVRNKISATKVVLESFKVRSITLDKVGLALSILVENPTIIALPLNSIEGEIYLMGVPCARINQHYSNSIPSRAISRVWLNFDIYQKQLGEGIWANIQTGSIETLLLKFVGYITIAGKSIYIDKEFTYNDLFKTE